MNKSKDLTGPISCDDLDDLDDLDYLVDGICSEIVKQLGDQPCLPYFSFLFEDIFPFSF